MLCWPYLRMIYCFFLWIIQNIRNLFINYKYSILNRNLGQNNRNSTLFSPNVQRAMEEGFSPLREWPKQGRRPSLNNRSTPWSYIWGEEFDVRNTVSKTIGLSVYGSGWWHIMSCVLLCTHFLLWKCVGIMLSERNTASTKPPRFDEHGLYKLGSERS